MIGTRTLRTPAPWGVAFALSLAPLLAVAQDGQLPTGPKVTAPATNANETLTDQGAETVPRVISDVLPPVPATAADPAPPGTRAVRVDGPVTAEGVPIGTVPDRQRAGQPMGRGIRSAEGVVVGLSAPENLDESDARLIVTIDPTISWDEQYGPGNSGAATTPSTLGAADDPVVQETRQAADAAQEAAQAAKQAAQAAKQAADAVNNPRAFKASTSNGPQDRADTSVEPNQGEVDQTNPSATQNPNRLTFVITKRTYIYAFARTAEGVDLYGAANDQLARQCKRAFRWRHRHAAGEPASGSADQLHEHSRGVVRRHSISAEGRPEHRAEREPDRTASARPGNRAGGALSVGATQPIVPGTSGLRPNPAATGRIEEPIVETPGAVVEPVPAGGLRVPSVPAEGGAPASIVP